MKKIISISFLLVTGAVLQSLVSDKNIAAGCVAVKDSNGVMKSAGPFPYNCGDPPYNNNCTYSGCHDDGVVNTGTAQVTLDLGNANIGCYVPNQTYTITVTISKTGMQRAGFQITAIQDSDYTISPGVVTLTNLSRTQKLDSTNVTTGCCWKKRVWVEHTLPGSGAGSGGINTWSYLWKAPATDVGSITFYLASLQANNNGNEAGDLAYTIQKTILASAVSIKETANTIGNVKVYPNPSNGNFNISLKDINAVVKEVSIYDNVGKLMQRIGYEKNNINISADYPSGIYFIRVNTDKGIVDQKILIEK
jgi:hypothetical protein